VRFGRASRILVPEAPRLAAQRPPDPILQALDAYAAGRYDEALAQIRAVRNGDDLLDGLKDDTPKWIDAASPEMRERRRRVAAALALEAVHVNFARAVIPLGTGGRDLVRGLLRTLAERGPARVTRLQSIADRSNASILGMSEQRFSEPLLHMRISGGSIWSRWS